MGHAHDVEAWHGTSEMQRLLDGDDCDDMIVERACEWMVTILMAVPVQQGDHALLLLIGGRMVLVFLELSCSQHPDGYRTLWLNDWRVQL